MAVAVAVTSPARPDAWCVEYLDDQEFYSFDMLNKALEDHSDFINDRRPFRGQDISRRQLFVLVAFVGNGISSCD